ncbi:MAG TPA: helix-turn-helix domain-containing protein [Alphaproteobacteria bacterium]|nr:helix-turn-helix domain-containing protein [Alphaproteobacteria bacterium]
MAITVSAPPAPVLHEVGGNRVRDIKREFGRRLREYRLDKGMTQARLAEKGGLSLDMIGRLERGQAAPSFKTIGKLCEILAVPPEALFGGRSRYEISPSEQDVRLQEICDMLTELNATDLRWIESIIRTVLRR